MKNTTIPERVKEPAVRGVAVQVLLLALSSLYWLSPIPLYILVGDFFIRAFIGPKLSPLAALSRWIMAPLFRFKLRMVTLRPKRFAA
ncbi:MAG: DUF4395 family protein, partial [Spirochaetaceae bacterium]|nr:DUF4395 family protein [Spirochaetaceae bacterium]